MNYRCNLVIFNVKLPCDHLSLKTHVFLKVTVSDSCADGVPSVPLGPTVCWCSDIFISAGLFSGTDIVGTGTPRDKRTDGLFICQRLRAVRWQCGLASADVPRDGAT